ncbi:MAG TPA: hypothetical protein VFQ76_16075, partial [Longimicrobiaceae bacterium]|nr:hypothetical protein [Longimicrobiaceae bacterium]
MESAAALSRPLRFAALAELLYAPVPLFLALTLLPLGATGASPLLLGVYLLQSAAAVVVAWGLRRGWWAAR